MLLQFSVSNYRSIRERQTLNFAASAHDKSLPGNVWESKTTPGLTDKLWIKGAAIFGANASGKTTVIEALKALRSMVGESAKTTDPKEPIHQIEPFALAGEPKSPTAFFVTFIMDNVRYEYRVAATPVRILHESLRAFPKAKEQLWFEREWSEESKNYSWSPDRPTGYNRKTDLESYTLDNVLYLSKAVANNQRELEPVFRWFSTHLRFIGPEVDFRFTLNLMRDGGPHYKQITKLLSEADLGVTGARQREVGKDKREGLAEKLLLEMLLPEYREELRQRQQSEPEPELFHKARDGQSVPLPWRVQSAGTKRLFSLVGPFLDICNNGYAVFIDEIEFSLHPKMVSALLTLIFSPQFNKGAQIIFTTHNPILLDQTLLRRDQIWFTEKDQEGATHLYPLTDFNPRDKESLTRGYLSGRYGGIPFIPDGLLSQRDAGPGLNETSVTVEESVTK